ncbi:putative ABC transporter ATP-binding protein [uncultured archaeon]|nr:putative ABC transporter ATP-binding protein [uncultured archaeon]
MRAYRDFDLQDDMYLYADAGPYNSTYGSTIILGTYTYATIGPWDPPEKNATEKTFTVTTKMNNPPVFGTPSPTNESIENALNPTWNILITDSEGDQFWWSIQCSNGLVTNSTGEEANGTKSLELSDLSYSTIYTIWVNATDPTGSNRYARKWYTFTTTSSSVVNNPVVFSGISPANRSTNVPISTSSLSFTIQDPEGESFNYTIQTHPNVGSKSVTGVYNGTKVCTISGLTYATTYRWYVNATDGSTWTRQWYTFTTISAPTNNPPVNNPPVNNPPAFSVITPSNGSKNISINTSSLSLSITDPEGKSFSYTIQTNPNVGSVSVNNVGNGTKSCTISSLKYETTYRWYVNATDGISWNRCWYTFTIVADSENNPQFNNPPNSPLKIIGPTSIEPEVSYLFSTITIDPDGDQIRFRFSWGDGTFTNWSMYTNSNTTVSASHAWNSISTYSICVIAQDIKGLNSSWSCPLTVTVSNNVSTKKSPDYLSPENIPIFIALGFVICFCIISIYLIWIYYFRKIKRKKLKSRPLPSGDGKSAVLVNNLSRIRGGKEILTDIKLDLKQGKLYAITGPSGSGKSRLMESIVGREKPTTGDVLILGIDIYKDKMKATRSFGFVPQRPELNIDQTPVENMINSAIQWSVKNPEEKINELLNKVGLQNRKNVKAGDLSGGQQKRLSIAMELLKEPPVLFLDEPTTGLDPEIQGNIFSIIQELNKEGVSIVMTTHNVEEAEMADEIIIINNGKIAVQGSSKYLASCTPGFGKIIQVDLSEVSETVIQCIKELESVKFMWRTGRHIRIFCNNPDVIKISNSIRRCGGKIEGIKTEKTSIQDIFRFYTGKSPEE